MKLCRVSQCAEPGYTEGYLTRPVSGCLDLKSCDWLRLLKGTRLESLRDHALENSLPCFIHSLQGPRPPYVKVECVRAWLSNGEWRWTEQASKQASSEEYINKYNVKGVVVLGGSWVVLHCMCCYYHFVLLLSIT